MKVTLQKDYRNIYTLSDLEHAHLVIAEMREDESTAKAYAEMAVREALEGREDYLDYIVTATAHTAKNCRILDAYGWGDGETGSGNMDVIIAFTARTYSGFVEGEAYLTDIWQTGCEPYKHHMFVQYFQKVD